ncbi:FAD-dependent monooxygenase [Propioniciclava sp. MC1595]|nr:FAD-dependent monooxygenase [Propioniciclava sp. MC1595]
MGTTLDDLKSHERWLVVDCLLKDGADPDLDEESVQYCDPRRPATYVPGPHNRRRWELMLHEHEDAAEMVAPERVWEMLEPWLTPAEATIERPAVYTFHSVVARGWAKGRVFLAGDACHQTPPFMGQGMCAGVRDAANLAWKLVEVVEGRADAELLDTYESERSPHVRTFIETAVRLGSVISTTASTWPASATCACAPTPRASQPRPRAWAPARGTPTTSAPGTSASSPSWPTAPAPTTSWATTGRSSRPRTPRRASPGPSPPGSSRSTPSPGATGSDASQPRPSSSGPTATWPPPRTRSRPWTTLPWPCAA